VSPIEIQRQHNTGQKKKRIGPEEKTQGARKKASKEEKFGRTWKMETEPLWGWNGKNQQGPNAKRFKPNRKNLGDQMQKNLTAGRGGKKKKKLGKKDPRS